MSVHPQESQSVLFRLSQKTRAILAAVFNPFTFLLAGGLLIFGFILDTEKKPGEKLAATASNRQEAVEDGVDAARVPSPPSPPDTAKTLVIHSFTGNELGKFQFFDDDSYSFQPNQETAQRFMFQRFGTGQIDFGVHAGLNSILITSQPDGTAELVVKGADGRVISGLQLNSEGELVTARQVGVQPRRPEVY